MPTATAVVKGLVVSSSIIMEKDDVLTFESHNVGNPRKIPRMLSYDKRCWVAGDDHARGVNKTALIVDASGILRRPNCDVR